MRILVYGVGAIGSLMVHYLCKAGNDVTIIARSTYDELKNSILKKAFSGQLVTCEPNSKKPKVKAVEYDETPFDIPDDWFWSNLGNYCDMYTGNSISESEKKPNMLD